MTKKTVSITVDAKTLPSFQGIADFLSREDLLEPHPDKGLAALDLRHSNYRSVAENAIQTCQRLAEESPSFVIDLGKAFIHAKEVKTWLILTGNDEKTSHFGKLVWLSKCWDNARVFRLLAFILSDKTAPYSKLTEPKAIFRHLNKLGLSPSHIEALRKLRNAESHSYFVESGSLKFTDKRGLGHSIPTDEIDNIFAVLNGIFEWWLLAILFVIPWAAPKFGLLAITGSVLALKAHGIPEYVAFINGLTSFRPKKEKPASVTVQNEVSLDDLEKAAESLIDLSEEELLLEFDRLRDISVTRISSYMLEASRLLQSAAEDLEPDERQWLLQKCATLCSETSKRNEIALNGYYAAIAQRELVETIRDIRRPLNTRASKEITIPKNQISSLGL